MIVTFREIKRNAVAIFDYLLPSGKGGFVSVEESNLEKAWDQCWEFLRKKYGTN